MRVLIAGAHGQVGHELVRLAPEGVELHGFSSTELDITSAEQVAAVLERCQPDLIINAAAYTAVDKAESEPERAYAVNRDGVTHLARAGIPLLHLSTDYVFAGDAQAPYQETDPTGPGGVYGASKLAGELALAEINPRHVIVRTSWVFGASGANFVKTMLRLGREREALGVVSDQFGCPTPAAEITRALWQLALHYRDHGSLEWGTYHYSGTPACSWHGFAQEIFRQAHALGMLERIPLLHPIATADYPTDARRPAWSVLNCDKLQRVHGISQADWQQQLGQVLRACQP